MTKPVFIITIDTEGDNFWAAPRKVTTENARFLPRFQALCEKYGFKPTYLTDYEMALDPYFQGLGCQWVRENRAEIGLHVHAWYSPPFEGVDEPGDRQLYLFELPDDLLYERLKTQHELLTRVFDIQPVSNRAGRWGFDERVARILVELGYLVDCSVTPGISWKEHPGGESGGSDYRGFPDTPYFMDLNDIRRLGNSPLLQVPVTIRPNYGRPLQQIYAQFPTQSLVARGIQKMRGPAYHWLSPQKRCKLREMKLAVDWALATQKPVLEFMLHSSEFMPGGSPTFQTAEDIENLYRDLDQLFAYIAAQGVAGSTLADYRRTVVSPSG